MTIVLVNPEIPQNTGTIARLCAVTNSTLELVHPLGFKIDDKHLRRAGLDYWKSVDVREIKSINSFKEKRRQDLTDKKGRYFYLTKHADKFYTEINWHKDDFMVFGSETSGLNFDVLDIPEEAMLRIPQIKNQRCLNLANAASIVLYEALRQQNFYGMV
ncbi:MAG: tRNA (uridine(34)/cytosine(34)/5-carboxymethylaminomethyluridine(34)-2'-O)-methyltransferase TrmL [Chlamydiae bacterium]|nr:MAG: tRNA (uridine(34)/cytosine(34)/5-carboxymethylaminomethyluridine(34)-2'-O)-methyltransferase TrmL [Chlamydiota bacterium]